MTTATASVILRVEGAPVVSVRIVLPGGARLESIPGLALVTGRMLGEGSAGRDWKDLALAAEARGMTPAAFGGLEAHGVAVDALASDLVAALDLAAELALEPRFDQKRREWIVRQAAGELEAQLDQADLATARAFLGQLYGTHPKGRPLQGSVESLASIGRDDCRSFHDAALARGGLLVVAGAIDEQMAVRASETLERALAGANSTEPPPVLPRVPAAAPSRREVETRAIDQAHLFVGQVTVERADPDYEALELLGVVLGSGPGLSGRILRRIRDREGLAYHAAAECVAGAGLDAGRLVLYAGVDEAKIPDAERAMREELERLVVDGVSDEEVEEARDYLVGREPFRRETARQRADLAVQAGILGLPLDDPELRMERLRSLDRGAVEAAARRRLDPGALSVTIGLPRGGVRR